MKNVRIVALTFSISRSIATLENYAECHLRLRFSGFPVDIMLYTNVLNRLLTCLLTYL